MSSTEKIQRQKFTQLDLLSSDCHKALQKWSSFRPKSPTTYAEDPFLSATLKSVTANNQIFGKCIWIFDTAASTQYLLRNAIRARL